MSALILVASGRRGRSACGSHRWPLSTPGSRYGVPRRLTPVVVAACDGLYRPVMRSMPTFNVWASTLLAGLSG